MGVLLMGSLWKGGWMLIGSCEMFVIGSGLKGNKSSLAVHIFDALSSYTSFRR
jgi:hypothetical protein